jgi:MoxR-like ATPase
LVLADEINRASPRTQSALLEVMAERTITVDGVSHGVPAPFMVLATQNPVEMDGTYPLPEAQLDRFLIKTDIGYPDHDAEVEVLHAEHTGQGVGDVRRVSSPGDIERLIDITRAVEVAPSLLDYIVRIVAHTRAMPELRLGSSPRGAIGLLKTSRVVAALEGRDYVVPSDVQSLAGVVLAHRVVVASAQEAAGMTGLDAIDKAVAAVPAPPLASLP